MKIVLRSSGDWQPEKEWQLDTRDLSPDRSRRVQSLMEACRQGATKTVPKHSGAAGQMQYRVAILPDRQDSDIVEFEFNEVSVAPEVLDVLDELVHEMNLGAGPENPPEKVRSFDVIFFDLGDTLVTNDRQWVHDAKDTLKELHDRGYRLGIISNTGDLAREQVLQLMPPDFDVSLFEPDLIRLSSETGFEKPAIEAFTSSVDAAGVSAEQCVFCTEEKAHALAAEQAGIHWILLASTLAIDIGELPQELDAFAKSEI